MTPIIQSSPITTGEILTVVALLLCVAVFAAVAWLEAKIPDDEEDDDR